MKKAANEAKNSQPEEKPVVVRSAKDAINAMYAAGNNKGLGDYLASSAKDILNAKYDQKQGSDGKSAASLHGQGSSKHTKVFQANSSAIHSAQPKARAHIIPESNSVDPLLNRTTALAKEKLAAERASREAEKAKKKAESEIRVPAQLTSLKLKPRRPMIGSVSTSVKPSVGGGLRKSKGAIRLNAPIHTHNPQVFQDFVKPGQTGPHPSIISQNTKKVNTEDTDQPLRPPVKRPTGGPRYGDMIVKRPMNKAPKDFASNKPEDVRPDQPYELVGYQDDAREKAKIEGITEAETVENTKDLEELAKIETLGDAIAKAKEQEKAEISTDVDAKNTDKSKDSAENSDDDDDAVHYYGLTEDDLDGTVRAQDLDKMAADAGLGVVEDYKSDSNIEGQVYSTGHYGPDNNKYALSSQSPYYLKTAEVEKRPLSGEGTTKSVADGALTYAAQKLTETPKKNQYKKDKEQPKIKVDKKPKLKKSTKTHKQIDNHPTVIIPSHHRSNAPLVALLLLTVILGIIVGGLLYLCFFQ